jgi:hypothetical protein
MNTRTKLTALIGAGVLSFALFGVASAAPDYATVSGHQASTAENNNPSFWGEDCTKLDENEGDLGAADSSYVLSADYSKVIVKAGSDQSAGDNALTIFDNPTAGQTVWADTNGNNTFDPGGKDGDKTISHIIFCGAAESSSSSTSFSDTVSDTTDSSSSSTSFSDTVSDTTESLPNTATIGSTDSSGLSGGFWMLVAGIGALGGSVLVLLPARAKNRK